MIEGELGENQRMEDNKSDKLQNAIAIRLSRYKIDGLGQRGC